jgi:thiol-disulfide isomerase/thioredoxin
MKKLIAILAIMGSMEAIQRTVLVEEFTATWCPYCPGAAIGCKGFKKLS